MRKSLPATDPRESIAMHTAFPSYPEAVADEKRRGRGEQKADAGSLRNLYLPASCIKPPEFPALSAWGAVPARTRPPLPVATRAHIYTHTHTVISLQGEVLPRHCTFFPFPCITRHSHERPNLRSESRFAGRGFSAYHFLGGCGHHYDDGCWYLALYLVHVQLW
jgi:hypothetical protein